MRFVSFTIEFCLNPTAEALLDPLMEARKLAKRIENGDLCACEWRLKVEGGTVCANCALNAFFGGQPW